MKIYFIIEIIAAYVALLLLNIYYVEMGVINAIITSGVATSLLGITLHFQFFRKKPVTSEIIK